jgi:glycosyltransferase involved in cell wall biosynthesis
MKICLIGHYDAYYDEGVRNVGEHIYEKLDDMGIKVRRMNVSSISEWKKIRDFRPDIIHFILTPTLSGLIAAKFISNICSEAKTVISALHPAVPNWKPLELFKPDLILIQSVESERLFKSRGYRTKFLPNGVDIDKFKPIDLETKRNLKNKYRIPDDKFVVLHLASLNKRRNLGVFKKIQKQEGNYVLIIGRENEKIDKQVLKELKDAECSIWIKHFSNIEEIYNLADCYVFPTINKRACIEIPLSVLEAMSCNLPIITTKFGALPRLFEDGDGFLFVEKEDDFHRYTEAIKNGIKVKTREKVLPYSWENIVKRLVGIYEELLC